MHENKWIEFLGQNWSKLLLGILAVACVAAWSDRYFRSHKSQSIHDFVIASQIYSQYEKGNTLPLESIEMTEAILKRHPELHPKYDSMLALTFFSQEKTAQGLQYAQTLMHKTRHQLPAHYRSYAQTSLLISEKKYSEAFSAALLLEKELENVEQPSILQAMNTLRLAFLADTLGDEPQKRHFWEAAQVHPHYDKVASMFKEGNLSLKEYLH